MTVSDPNSSTQTPSGPERSGRVPLPGMLRISWLEMFQVLVPVLLLAVLSAYLAMHFGGPAPPHTITIAAGPRGSNFDTVARRYQAILKRNGVTLNVLQTRGSLENLDRLSNPKSHVDVALVQAGLTEANDTSDLVSLGSVFYQPLTIFYRAAKPIERLSVLQGLRIAIGPEGSGTRALALALLKQNEIEPGQSTQLTSDEGEGARAALLKHAVDAIFLSGDSAAGATIREMLHTEGVRLFDYPQANAYVRRFPYLNRLVVPAGAFDLGENLPKEDQVLLAPTVELLAHSNLHPAITDLLIGAAQEVHGHASVMQAAGQFPTPTMNSYPIDDEAARYYKSGDRSFLYRHLPFWLASLFNRIVVLLVPIVVVLVPGLRYLPQLYRWRIARRIHLRYVELMAVERQALGALSGERRAALLERLGQIERSVISHPVPGSFAEQLFVLREHIQFVRANLGGATPPASAHAR